MPGENGVSLPLAALSIVALFLSTAFLGQRAFDLMRLGESDVDKRPQLSQPPVESRLWEDPFAALVRHRAKLKELCAPAGSATIDMRCARGEVDAETFRKELTPPDGGDLTVIAVMLPGAAFIGVEEARRRVRYAVLAGLNAERFVPEDSEHMGLLHVRLCAPFTGCAAQADWPLQNAAMTAVQGSARQRNAAPSTIQAPKTDILYETFVGQHGTSGERRRAVVLWIDDTAVVPGWLSTLANLLGEVAPADSRLRIIGPYRSDDLVKGLDDLWKLRVEAHGTISERREAAIFDALARLRLVSPFATAPASSVRLAASHSSTFSDCPAGRVATDCVEQAFEDRLAALNVRKQKASRFFVRTIGNDRRQIELLVRELCARGVAHRDGGRVILLSEWDSIYARTSAATLRARLEENFCRHGPAARLELENYFYLRGLDGANVDGATRQVRLVPRGAGRSKDGDNDAAIEWPESRDQRDYVRRLVARLEQGVKWGNPATEVRAIGIIGTDVHDKLVLLQALRAAFSDRVLFTTDLDARLVHPEVTHYTRNLIVASSLPLALDESVQPDVGPFRDVYQTATYLGARYAAAFDEPAAGKMVERELAPRRLYEIGRDGVVALSIDGIAAHEAARRAGFAVVAGILLLGVSGFMLVGKPSGSMKVALSRGSGRLGNFKPSTAILAGVQVAALGFAAGIVLELGVPGAVGPGRALLIAAATTVCFWALVYPGVRGLRAVRLQFIVRLLLIGLVAGLAWWLWLEPTRSGMREPFAPLSGVSAWPAELVRTLALLLFVWLLDYAWTDGRSRADEVGCDYFPAPNAAASMGPSQRSVIALVRRRIGEVSIWFWNPLAKQPDGRVDGWQLWHEYRRLMRNGPRLCRIVAWLVVAGLAVGMLWWLSEGVLPEIPARGLDDRELFRITTFAAALGTVVLLVLVGDATVLTFRFVLLLKGARTAYPCATVERFAAELGTDPALHEVAAERIAARIRDRGNAAVVARNSLLDDWIDARLLADHTAAVGPLILAPFILVALLLVARSGLFDNWAIGGIVLMTMAGYLLWAIAMAVLLNLGAEMARRKAIESMRQDLLWMQGCGERYKPLAQRFPDMIQQVQTLRRGAFAPFFEKPLVQAILVPLGGAGGVQLLDLILFARA